jgi:anaerobic magnesium-protoporphyrin IX monomethyl ester cyclase
VKVALIKPPATYADWYKQPALGIAHIAASLESEGHDCEIVDAYFQSLSLPQLVRCIKDYNPDVVGITAMTHEINEASEIASKLKAVIDVPTVVGGCHVTALPEKTLAEFGIFDYGVYGEGEKTTIELLEHIGRRVTNPYNIKGLIFRNEGKVVVNPPRQFMTTDELDALPRPAFHHYYGAKNAHALASKDSYYVMLSSRGCPYNCAFCMQVLGKKVRRRSAQSILREIDYAVEHYGAHTFNFADEIFLFDDRKTRNILRLFIQRDLPKRIRWSALTRANFVNPELISLAKKAGCFRLEMGVESGDDGILKAIGKNITVEQVRQSVETIKKTGISLGTYYILGHPNETIETLRKTVDLAVELNTDVIAVGLMVPYPGTRIFDMALQGKNGYRLLSKNWAEYDKYGGRVLEIDGLPHKKLVKWQKRALLYLYLKNFRFLDGFRFLWKRRRALSFVIRKKIIMLVRSMRSKGA